GSEVDALVVYNGVLIAGGVFNIAGGGPADFIAQWNGTTWQSVGTGTNGSVNALAVYNNNLIAGGTFTFAGGSAANFIAQWNGTTWSAMGGGAVGGPITDAVLALTVYNGNLIADAQSASVVRNSEHFTRQWNHATRK